MSNPTEEIDPHRVLTSWGSAKPLNFHDEGLYDEIEDYGRNVILTNNYDLDCDPDPIYNAKTGEIYRKTKWISKEGAKKVFPEIQG